MLMSFLGSVGFLMNRSGLEELFQEIYALNSVSNFLSGKNTARAIRAHTIAHSALMTIFLEEMDDPYTETLKEMYEKAINRELQQNYIENAMNSDLHVDFCHRLETKKKALREKSRTSKL